MGEGRSNLMPKTPSIEVWSEARIRSGTHPLQRFAEPSAALESRVKEILADVRKRGDAAVLELTARFDKVQLTSKSLRLHASPPRPSKEIDRLLREALGNIQSFSKERVLRSWRKKNRDGAVVGEEYHPFERVGLYVPGGTAPLVSTALMTVGLAQQAGVKEIVVATPPKVNPYLHYALQLCGVTEIYQMGGAQAIAALAYGTKSIRRVQKIFGPGNAFVVEAKRQVFGSVAIDLLPGPSEIAILADESARADYVAADLLAQGEHGHGSQAILISTSERFLQSVQKELVRQAEACERKEFIAEVLAAGCRLVRVPSLKVGIQLAEDYAPEHLTVMVKNADRVAKSIRNAGAIFIGNESPVAAGDYWAGPSHTLPTGGAGKSFGGLTIEQFYKRVSWVAYDSKSIRKAAPRIAAMAALEQLDAHAKSARIRVKKEKSL